MKVEPGENVDQVIARRILFAAEGKTIEIEIFLPILEFINDSPVWNCSYRIKGMLPDYIRKACGEDSVQAVWGALNQIGSFLYTSDEYKSGNLRLFSPNGPTNLGFPVLNPIFGELHDLDEFEVVRI